MAGATSDPGVQLLCTPEDAERARDELLCCDVLALDLEGARLGRHGQVHLVVMAARDGPVYCFDALALGARLFAILRPLLVSPTVAKLCYDGRCDADALLHLHGVALRHALDLQVAYTALHQAPTDPFLKGLSVALHTPNLVRDRAELARAAAFKARFKRAMRVCTDGCPAAPFAARPLPADVLAYCAVDVRHLFSMFDAWCGHGGLARDELAALTEERLRAFCGRPAPPPSHLMSLVDFPVPQRRRWWSAAHAYPRAAWKRRAFDSPPCGEALLCKRLAAVP